MKQVLYSIWNIDCILPVNFYYAVVCISQHSYHCTTLRFNTRYFHMRVGNHFRFCLKTDWNYFIHFDFHYSENRNCLKEWIRNKLSIRVLGRNWRTMSIFISLVFSAGEYVLKCKISSVDRFLPISGIFGFLFLKRFSNDRSIHPDWFWTCKATSDCLKYAQQVGEFMDSITVKYSFCTVLFIIMDDDCISKLVRENGGLVSMFYAAKIHSAIPVLKWVRKWYIPVNQKWNEK